MLYTTYSKPFCLPNNALPRAHEHDSHQLPNSHSKGICGSLQRRGRQRHGRKPLCAEGRQGNSRCGNSPLPLRSLYSSQTGEKRGSQCRPNMTIYQQYRPHNPKRHTYNHYCSSEREEETENQVVRGRETTVKSKKGLLTTEPHGKVKHGERRLLRERQEVMQNEQEVDENTGQFLQPKRSYHLRKPSIYSKLTPIDFTEPASSAKPSLVDLIRRFKFENLKTTNANNSANSIEDHKKYEETNFARAHSKQKTHPFFQEPNGLPPPPASQIQHRKMSRRPPKQLQREGRGLKKSSSILSPWGTVTDHFFVNHSPID